ncbi:hypothetical protein IMZ31_07295 [Pontibacillus sp. ALD_SL1]|uniref:hypothetical protein n=1 Tax=Pontibacillus sp. ALD_SL1 TaxID=2777185 RepID=UPI001A963AE7|nr:hypothetical protein [Pontibacillus sp. ALD_SL1]QST01357.1 hypothetical protein IMZ31_07295 [Pontibacillus sp. ALD_SL1]
MESLLQFYIYIAVVINGFIGVVSYKKSQHQFVFATGFTHIILSIPLSWTFGPLVFAIGTTQVFYGIIHTQSRKTAE